MMGIILNRLKPEAEIIAEEQVGFHRGRSTTDQIFNLWMLCGRCLRRQRGLYRVFIDFGGAFDRVWHAALWATMRLYNINTNLINAIQNLYDKATSAVCFGGGAGGWFRAAVGVGQGCLLSPTLFDVFLEGVVADALGDHGSKVGRGGGTVSDLRFAGDVDGLAGSELELAGLVGCLGGASAACGMRVSVAGTRLMTSGTGGIGGGIGSVVSGLETVRGFKCLGAVVADKGSMPGVRSRVAQTVAALTMLGIIWDDKNMDLGSGIWLLLSLVMSIFLYSCETWDINSRNREKDTDSGNEKFQTSPWHLVQRPHHQRRGAKQDSESHWTLQRTLVHCKKMQNEVVWACHKSFGTCQDSPPGYCAGGGEADGESDGKITSGIGWVWNWAKPWGERGSRGSSECWLPGRVVPQRSPRPWDR